MPPSKRQSIATDTKALVLHECGYRCANPVCRTILTIEIHHLEQVSDGGNSEPQNLLPLCPNCHTLHHRGVITQTSLRAWKHLLLALNQAFDTKLVDLLLTLHKLKAIVVTGDGILQCAPGIAAGLIITRERQLSDDYWVSLSKRGLAFVEGWERGDQSAAIGEGEP